MKNIKLLIACISIISFLACNKNAPEDLSNINVETYIDLLKKGNYDTNELPTFTDADIPALLEYRNETQKITDFPRNGISSLALPECKLGMYVLWTVESIRAVAIESEFLIGRFPSLNPIVQQKEEPFDLEQGNEVQEIIAQAYFEWWENNKDKEFIEFNNDDPLIQTEYRWH